MVSEHIICIFCGKRADIIDKGNLTIISCGYCNRETEGNAYQVMFDKWLGNVRKIDSERR